MRKLSARVRADSGGEADPFLGCSASERQTTAVRASARACLSLYWTEIECAVFPSLGPADALERREFSVESHVAGN